MTQDDCKSLDELIATLVKYHPEADTELVRKAYAFAERRMRVSCASRASRISSTR